jgi:hypothetical protein
MKEQKSRSVVILDPFAFVLYKVGFFSCLQKELSHG